MEMLWFGLGYIALGAVLLFAAFKKEAVIEDEILDVEVLPMLSTREMTNLPSAQIERTATAAKRVLS